MKAQVRVLSREQLEQERDSLLAEIGDCPAPDQCLHHEFPKIRLEEVEWLLASA